MQKIILDIKDQKLGTDLNLMARRQGKDVAEIAIGIIQRFIEKKSASPIKKLDPLRHSTQIKYQTEENLEGVKPFANVKNSARFGRELRGRLWDRAVK